MSLTCCISNQPSARVSLLWLHLRLSAARGASTPYGIVFLRLCLNIAHSLTSKCGDASPSTSLSSHREQERHKVSMIGRHLSGFSSTSSGSGGETDFRDLFLPGAKKNSNGEQGVSWFKWTFLWVPPPSCTAKQRSTLARIERQENNLERIKLANSQFYQEKAVDIDLAPVPPERKPAFVPTEDNRPYLKIGEFCRVETNISSKYNRPKGYGYITETLGVGLAAYYTVKLTPAHIVGGRTNRSIWTISLPVLYLMIVSYLAKRGHKDQLLLQNLSLWRRNQTSVYPSRNFLTLLFLVRGEGRWRAGNAAL